ncbi:aldose 1-epimerase family protein [Neptunitalea lumnitzerae]|uniref:Galactose mutarotase n=1 Tax=Neptunitalea lumnitzerae TaxID=2965509 RepID=A0ABQ5MLI1_9FLAO|nr:aldose 1-epimerase family protein [Neptunitalea sp. Y10]GLB49812.1 galactose mutarotase [Neptunitalea sp. Y10]
MKIPKKLSISNKYLTVTIKTEGAEICSITDQNGTEYMWDANPDVWSSHAPVLFPIIGSLKDKHFTYEGKKYYTPKHGFIRHNENLKVEDHSDSAISFRYTYSEDTLAIYPFKFDFTVTFSLEEKTLKVYHAVKNLGDETMLFSLGGHPAFKCPLTDAENYDDYLLSFETEETCDTHLLDKEGLQSGKTAPLLQNDKILRLQHDLFKDDALILKDLVSRKVSLCHETKGEVITVIFDDFNYLGVWAKPSGDFVCIEPWLGVTDASDTDGDFTKKEGNLQLEPQKEYEASYYIQIH